MEIAEESDRHLGWVDLSVRLVDYLEVSANFRMYQCDDGLVRSRFQRFGSNTITFNDIGSEDGQSQIDVQTQWVMVKAIDIADEKLGRLVFDLTGETSSVLGSTERLLAKLREGVL